MWFSNRVFAMSAFGPSPVSQTEQSLLKMSVLGLEGQPSA